MTNQRQPYEGLLAADHTDPRMVEVEVIGFRQEAERQTNEVEDARESGDPERLAEAEAGYDRAKFDYERSLEEARDRYGLDLRTWAEVREAEARDRGDDLERRDEQRYEIEREADQGMER